MTTEIETYLNSLSKDILTLNISGKCKGIKSLPDLTRFKNLQKLSCDSNQLTYLPTLPQNLKYLSCYGNQLTSLPTLPQNLEELFCSNNLIYEIVNNDSLITIKQNIQTLNNFRHLYYCLKFKKQLRKWLWEKVREPIIKKLYNPMYLIENLGQDDDLDTVLNNWN
jgi:Leucine-rich repeat (LRR) protein